MRSAPSPTVVERPESARPIYDTDPRRWALGTWMLAVAWVLYVCSVLLPSASIQNPDGPPGQGLSGTYDERMPGYEILQLVFLPLLWIFIIPFIYCLVNLAFYLTLPFLIRRSVKGTSAQYRCTFLLATLTGVAAAAAWLAPFLLLNVFVGYFFRAASITLAALALFTRAEAMKLRGDKAKSRAP